MLHASTQKLIIKLCDLTEAGHIAWQRGEGRAFRFETEGYVVEVLGQPATLRLLHSDGNELERADEPDLAAQPWPDGAGTFETHITLLAARADRIARGAELAISRILTSLSAPPKAAPFDFLSRASTPAAEPAPPPAPHTTPGPPPNPIGSDTAIDRVLAVEPSLPRIAEPPAPETAPEPVIMESETTAIVGDAKTAEEIIAATAEERIDPPVQETPAAEPAPVIIEAETVAVVAEPQPVDTIVPAPALKPAPQPVMPPPQNAFGATHSFARSRGLTATPRTTSPKTYSTSPFFAGVNQMTRQPVRTEPEPAPIPAPAPKPVPQTQAVAERKPEPVIAGPDIYKPWS